MHLHMSERNIYISLTDFYSLKTNKFNKNGNEKKSSFLFDEFDDVDSLINDVI